MACEQSDCLLSEKNILIIKINRGKGDCDARKGEGATCNRSSMTLPPVQYSRMSQK
jgi:hypothetical protein